MLLSGEVLHYGETVWTQLWINRILLLHPRSSERNRISQQSCPKFSKYAFLVFLCDDCRNIKPVCIHHPDLGHMFYLACHLVGVLLVSILFLLLVLLIYIFLNWPEKCLSGQRLIAAIWCHSGSSWRGVRWGGRWRGSERQRHVDDRDCDTTDDTVNTEPNPGLYVSRCSALKEAPYCSTLSAHVSPSDTRQLFKSFLSVCFPKASRYCHWQTRRCC